MRRNPLYLWKMYEEFFFLKTLALFEPWQDPDLACKHRHVLLICMDVNLWVLQCKTNIDNVQASLR